MYLFKKENYIMKWVNIRDYNYKLSYKIICYMYNKCGINNIIWKIWLDEPISPNFINIDYIKQLNKIFI